jgi:hypothetical protein
MLNILIVSDRPPLLHQSPSQSAPNGNVLENPNLKPTSRRTSALQNYPEEVFAAAGSLKRGGQKTPNLVQTSMSEELPQNSPKTPLYCLRRIRNR